MKTFESFAASLNSINDSNFEVIALELFRFQAQYNPTYQQYVQALRINPNGVERLLDIPFLPISFFKTQTVKTNEWQAETTFLSSGTTSISTSRHQVWSREFYLNHALQIFEAHFGSIEGYHLLALLPSYLERQGSSLIAMIDRFIQATRSPHSGFFLHDHEKLLQKIEELKDTNRKTILWGVSFALLDLSEAGPLNLSHCLVFETGGMKGRSREMVREEFHERLRIRLGADPIYSEYGMTELLSQAYSVGKGYFQAPPQMKIVIRDVNDPFSKGRVGVAGGINVIDLANFHSCAFIETQDLGRLLDDGSFEVLGRFDNSDLRGCNLLV